VTPLERKYAALIAETMRKQREQKRLSQKDIAQALGVSQSAISKYEAGARVPSIVFWFDFCLFLGIDPSIHLPTLSSLGRTAKDSS
jgi:transcriptional regulator with XRE-family HTH domain